jgi:drug/metabolite transporter (DMT)-like permease
MLILVLLLYVLFASTFTFGKAAMTYMHPALFVGIRMTVAGLILLGYQYFFNYKLWRLERRHYALFAAVTFFAIFLSYLLEFEALNYVTSFKVALLFNLSPFITALLSHIHLAERLTVKQWTGLCIGFLGVLPVVGSYNSFSSATTSGLWVSVPEIMIFGAVFSACYGWTLFKKLVAQHHYSPIMVNGVSMLAGGILALLVAVCAHGGTTLRTTGMIPDAVHMYIASFWCGALCMAMFYMIILIIIANLITYNLYGYLLTHYSATFLAFAGFITPFFTAIFGWLLLGECITWHFIASITIILVGLYLFYQDEKRQDRNQII